MKIKNTIIVEPISKYNKIIKIECINEVKYYTGKPSYDIYLLDKNNNLIAHFENKKPFSIEVMDDGRLFALNLQENECRLYKINKDNTYTLLNTYEEIEFGKEDNTHAVKKNNLWGFIDNNGYEIIFPQYTKYYSFCNGLAFVRYQDKKWGVINKENKIIVPFEYDRPQDYHIDSNCIVLKKADCYHIYNTKGEIVFMGEKHQKIFNLGNSCILAKNKDADEYKIVRIEE